MKKKEDAVPKPVKGANGGGGSLPPCSDGDMNERKEGLWLSEHRTDGKE